MRVVPSAVTIIIQNRYRKDVTGRHGTTKSAAEVLRHTSPRGGSAPAGRAVSQHEKIQQPHPAMPHEGTQAEKAEAWAQASERDVSAHQ